MSVKNRFQKLHQTTNPKHQEDYVFVEKHGEDFTGLKLISGPFKTKDEIVSYFETVNEFV
jgi:hypothetical protein